MTSQRKRARVAQELGRTPFVLPGSQGRSCFELTTHFTGRSSLRHFLSGLRKIENHYKDAELVQVNQVEVSTMSHSDVVSCLHHHMATITDREMKLTLRARDRAGQKHIIEVEITVMYEDSLGDKVRAAYDIIVRTTDKIISTPDVTDVEFESSSYIRIRHGAQTGFFLKEGRDHTMCMAIPQTAVAAEYVFKCYKFIGHNRESEGGGGGEFPTLCVLQLPRSGRFVAACATPGCLRADEDVGFHTDIEAITTPDCHFFIIHPSGNTTDSFCLRPLVMRNYYLHYDAVKGLQLTKCRTPPYRDFSKLRFFSFEFMPAQCPDD